MAYYVAGGGSVKKIISGIIIGILLTTSTFAATQIKTAYYNEQIKVRVNGQYIQSVPVTVIDQGQTDGRNFTSVRDIAEAMGGTVYWNSDTKTIDVVSVVPKVKAVSSEPEKPKEKTIEEIAENVKYIVYIEAYNNKNECIGTASGFIATNMGDVITNYHVIDYATKVKVYTNDNKEYTSTTVCNYNKSMDLAILKLDTGSTFDSTVLGDSNTVKIGDDVIAIGNPLGLRNTVSEGIVSGLREIDNNKMIQISAPISPGSSGGALFDKNGCVIGITSSGIPGAGDLNFAIPINCAKILLSYYANYSLQKVYELEHIVNYNNGDKYEGDLKNGYRHGYGTYTFASGMIYEGEWINGVMEGNGKMIYIDGGNYCGEWKDDKRHGYGVYISADSAIKYEGQYYEDKMNGEGMFTSNNGIIIGNWINDVLEGNGIFIDANGIKHNVEFKNGEFIKIDGRYVN